MDAAVRLLTRREIPAASRLLMRAFASDPFIGHLLANERRRRLAFPPFFRSVLYESVPLRSVWAAEREGALVGVAAWTPPAAGSAGLLAGVRARTNITLVRVLFPRRSGPLLAGFESLAAHHPQQPHWYLAFVGIEPRLQGRGIGGALLAPLLERADADGDLCYLETPFAATHEFYRRLGFEIEREIRPVAGAPPVWTMARPPSSRPATIPPGRGVEH